MLHHTISYVAIYIHLISISRHVSPSYWSQDGCHDDTFKQTDDSDDTFNTTKWKMNGSHDSHGIKPELTGCLDGTFQNTQCKVDGYHGVTFDLTDDIFDFTIYK